MSFLLASLRRGRFALTIVMGILLIWIGVSVFAAAWDFLGFEMWCYSNRIPCPLFSLNYHILGLNFSTVSHSTAQALLNLGFDVVVLGFALIFLTIVNALARSDGVS